MTLPTLITPIAVNSSGTAVANLLLTRPTNAAPGDLLVALTNLDSTSSTIAVGMAAQGWGTGLVKGLSATYSDGKFAAWVRRATASDPASWTIPIATANTAYLSLVAPYRDVLFHSRSMRVNTANTVISGVSDLYAPGGYDTLPIHCVAIDGDASGRILTPGVGQLVSVFDQSEPTTFLKLAIFHANPQNAEAFPLSQVDVGVNASETSAVIAFALSGVAPSGVKIPDGEVAEYPKLLMISGNKANEGLIAIDTPVPTVGQVWPRGFTKIVPTETGDELDEMATIIYRTSHGFMVAGPVAPTFVVPDFYVTGALKQTSRLIGIIARLDSGTSVDVSVRRNGTVIDSPITVTTFKSYASYGQDVFDGDALDLTFANPVGDPTDLGVTLIIEHTIEPTV
jgi:hypothetical protein